jgi:N-acetylglutamate synthase-like GNAT family acetyltransferase
MTMASNSEGITIREATAHDGERLRNLLAQIELGADDVLAPGTRYWLAENGGDVVGVVGLEYGAGAVLLRSAAVRPDMRGAGLGAALVGHALDHAAAEGHTRAYLFSTGAGSYWARQGFREVPVPQLVILKGLDLVLEPREPA